jgi:hypothetical protein
VQGAEDIPWRPNFRLSSNLWLLSNTCAGRIRNSIIISVEKSGGNSLIGRPRHRCNSIEIVLTKFDVYGFNLMKKNCPFMAFDEYGKKISSSTMATNFFGQMNKC